MRRVICDVFILVTTISAPTATAADCAALGLPTDPQVLPPSGPPVDPLPLGLARGPDRAAWWTIYQEFIFVHCQRVAASDDNVIDSA